MHTSVRSRNVLKIAKKQLQCEVVPKITSSLNALSFCGGMPKYVYMQQKWNTTIEMAYMKSIRYCKNLSRKAHPLNLFQHSRKLKW